MVLHEEAILQAANQAFTGPVHIRAATDRVSNFRDWVEKAWVRTVLDETTIRRVHRTAFSVIGQETYWGVWPVTKLSIRTTLEVLR